MTSPRKEKREETFFAKENARLRKLKKKKAKNKSGWFSQPSRLATGKPGVSERLANVLGETPGERAGNLAAGAALVSPGVGGAANLAKVGVHALSVRARLARRIANKSSRKKSIDGIARKGHTRAPHR